METEQQLAEKQRKHEIIAEFYSNVRDNTLPKFYKGYNNKNLKPTDYMTIVEITHDHFCHDETIDRTTAAQQSIAAHHLNDLNDNAKKSKNEWAKQTKFGTPDIEFGCRTSVLMEPDDLVLLEAWKQSMWGASKNLKAQIGAKLHEQIEDLGLEKTIFGSHVRKKFEI